MPALRGFVYHAGMELRTNSVNETLALGELLGRLAPVNACVALHGNLGAAWALNPLTVILLPFLAYGIASYAVFEIRGRHLPRLFLPAVSIRALCAVIVLFGIARNIPFHPFDLLAPAAVIHH